MTHQVFVTSDVAERAPRGTPVVQPGDQVPGAVVVTSTESLAGWAGAEHQDTLWIVLGDVDGGSALQPFLSLPVQCSGGQVARAIDAALELRRVREKLREQTRAVELARDHQLDLVRVGIALTAERDLDRLLRLILSTARELVDADAGSLYLIEDRDGERILRFALAQNDSVPPTMVASTMEITAASLAGYVARTGEPMTVDDVRKLPPDAPYGFDGSFDLAIGYHTRSALTAPIGTRAGQVIGVLQLINRKTSATARVVSAEDADAVVRPFGQSEVWLIRALAAQAAVAIENTRLMPEIETLFEGFVRAAVLTIEQRDPATSGHSHRVANYTVALAQALEANPPAPYRGLRFSRDEMLQLRYAALLHDFGKVGVREAVLTKAKKLYPERMSVVQERFRHAVRAQEAALLRRLLAALRDLGRAPTAEDLANLDFSVSHLRAEYEAHLAAVTLANEPAVLEQATAHLVTGLQHVTFPVDGAEMPLLLPEEARALSVSKGSLDEAERREMESHVVHSYQFLLTIPWPKRLARVPSIAFGHHEKLNGRGYPNRLPAEEIPPEVRMMTVSDIYDALTVGDRPYKRSVPCERALAILEDEVRGGFLDADLVKLFVEARVYAHSHTDAL